MCTINKIGACAMIWILMILTGAFVPGTAEAQPVQIYESLRSMVKEDGTWPEVKAFYEQHLETEVEKRNPGMSQMLMETLQEELEQNHDRDTAAEALDKALHWHDYKQIIHLTGEKAIDALNRGDREGAEQALREAEQKIADTLEPVAKQRDEEYGTFTKDNLHTVIFPALYTSIDKDDKRQYRIFQQMLDKLLLKILLMDLVKSVQMSEHQLNAGNVEKARTYFVGALWAYYPLHEWLKPEASEESAVLLERLHRLSLLDQREVLLDLTAAVNAKIHQNLKETLMAAEEGKDVLEQAASDVAAAGMLELIVKEWHGKEGYQEVQKHGELYFASVQDQDPEKARHHAFHMLKELTRIKGVYLTVGGHELVLNGSKVETVHRTTYLDPQTRRTLASARLIAEVLGVRVDYEKKEKKMTLTKGDQKIILFVGKREVWRNGQTARLSLSQPVTLDEGRVYLPLRDIVELLGKQLFWHRGEIIIN